MSVPPTARDVRGRGLAVASALLLLFALAASGLHGHAPAEPDSGEGSGGGCSVCVLAGGFVAEELPATAWAPAVARRDGADGQEVPPASRLSRRPSAPRAPPAAA